MDAKGELQFHSMLPQMTVTNNYLLYSISKMIPILSQYVYGAASFP